MKKKKLSLSLACAFGLLIIFLNLNLNLCIPAHAEEEMFQYKLKADGTAEISCSDKTIEYAEIPEEIDGHSITSLADGCFANCESLKEVKFSDSVQEIGENAFYGCIALREINIPENVTTIGAYAFDATEELNKFSVDEKNRAYTAIDGVLYTKDVSNLIKYPESKPETSYTLPDTCRKIEDWAFIGSQFLEEIQLNQVKEIGEDAFCWCVALKEITIPEGVEVLDGAVFSYCKELEKVVLPSTIKALGNRCFYSCTNLKEINLPEGLQKLGEYTFCHCTALTSLTVPESLVTVNINCMGYVYDEENNNYQLQDNFKLYVYKNSAAWKYAVTNHIDCELLQTAKMYYILIGIFCAVILILIIAIVKVLKNRREKA